MQKIVNFIWHLFRNRPTFVWRIVIMFFVGGMLPVFGHMFLSNYYPPKVAVGIVLLTFWPLAAWLMYCRNEGWFDDD